MKVAYNDSTNNDFSDEFLSFCENALVSHVAMKHSERQTS